MPASAAGKGLRTCQCVRSHRYGGVEPPDPVKDQDFPAVQATTMRGGHTGALTTESDFVRPSPHPVPTSWVRRGEGHKAANLALGLQARPARSDYGRTVTPEAELRASPDLRGREPTPNRGTALAFIALASDMRC